jgi:hypothetical protein
MRMTKHIILLITIIISLCAHGQTTNKKVLILWDSSESNSKDYTTSLAHQKYEVILNHFGIQADYLDINIKIPPSFLTTKKSKHYASLISWVSNDKSKNPIDVFKVFKLFNKQRKKIVILGDIPLNNHPNQSMVINFFKNNYFLEYTNKILENKLVLEIKNTIDSNIVEFERPLSHELSKVRVVHAKTKIKNLYLTLKDKIENIETDVIFKTDKLFYAQSNYILYTNTYNSVSQWRINPFHLTKWILDFKTELVPDTTTLYGKRIMYSHIDGDAFISISQIDRKSYCGEIVLEKIINKYKLPVSTSFVMAEIDEKILGSKRLTGIIKSFLKNPYIEVASHTYSHPLSWNQVPTAEEIEIYSGIKKNYTKGPILAYKIPNYTSLDYNKEIVDSLKFINNLSPENKKTNMVFWSGSCRPPKEALKIIKDNNLLNMNGGDSRFDKRFPSFSHLYPLYRKVGPYYQIYSSNSNENTYTNLWEGPFGGFSEVIETFKNTEKPYRIKPINIYYHFYSGERESSVTALHKVYSWAITQDIIPIFTSEYIKIANSFKDVQVIKRDSSSYIIKNNKNLRTFKIDKKIAINYSKSKNVIGHYHADGVTYISTLPNSKIKIVTAKKRNSNYPFIIQSDGLVDKFDFNNNKLNLKFNSSFNKKITLNSIGLKIKDNEMIQNITINKEETTIEFKENKVDTILEFI